MNLDFGAALDIANVAAHRPKQKPALDAPYIERWRIQPPAQIQEIYDYNSRVTSAAHFEGFRVATCLILGLSATLVFAEDESPTRATHILGLEGVANNASGTLSIQKDALQFDKDPGLTAQISVGSITNVSLGEQDKQVGGVPMALGRAAAPFGGGRAISLFSHKKYDTLTVEYLDSKGGLHGVIFQLSKGNAQVIRKALVADGAHLAQPEDHGAKVSIAEIKDENK